MSLRYLLQENTCFLEHILPGNEHSPYRSANAFACLGFAPLHVEGFGCCGRCNIEGSLQISDGMMNPRHGAYLQSHSKWMKIIRSIVPYLFFTSILLCFNSIGTQFERRNYATVFPFERSILRCLDHGLLESQKEGVYFCPY
jgi:hypothetical protein